MTLFSTFKYGTGVLYGSSTTVTTVAPETGPSPGENSFVLTGTGFDPRHWDDFFTGLVLDPVKWVDGSFGSGSVSTGPFHLELVTGAVALSGAGIESVAQWGSTQGEIRFTLPPISEYPTDVVKLMVLCLWIGANDYAIMYIELGAAPGTLVLRCEIYRGGALADELIRPLPWTTGLSTFKILRWGSNLYFYANGNEVWRSQRFTDAAAKFQVGSTNGVTTYNLQGVRVQWFYYRPFAVFQDQPVHDSVVVSDFRMRGRVSPSADAKRVPAAYAGDVDVHAVGNGSFTLADAYEYYYVDALKVINSTQADTRFSIINDPQLLTPADEQKGLGGGT